MLCEHCNKREANISLTQIIQGKKIELHLCEVCAKEHEYHVYNSNPSFQQFLGGLMKLSGVEQQQNKQPITNCTKCHLSLDEFKKNSKLGCDECYKVFEPYIKHILKSVHGGYKHTGKRPLRLNKEDILKERIEDVESKLRIALMQEDYLEAARYRDELRHIKEDM